MFGSAILEVAIGVIFVYLLVSLLCSSVREGIESWTKTRAAYLEYGIRELLQDRKGVGLAASLFKHPLIFSLYSGEYAPGVTEGRPGLLARGNSLPSYIPAKSFAAALLDLAARGPKADVANDAGPPLTLAAMRANVLQLENPAVQRVLLMAIDSAQGDIDRARAALEAWYDTGMERVAGWYKRSTQWIILWIALAVTIIGNFNTIVIARYLYRNDAVRAALADQASVSVSDPTLLTKTYDQTRALLDTVQLPIGWGAASPTATGAGVAVVALGWLMTALAATLGAPFWFDVLKKVIEVRSTIKPSAQAPEQPAAPASPPTPKPSLAFDNEALAAAVASMAARSAENDVDSCAGHAPGQYDETPDDELPVATGGVA